VPRELARGQRVVVLFDQHVIIALLPYDHAQ
jgi:hypothetical protein